MCPLMFFVALQPDPVLYGSSPSCHSGDKPKSCLRRMMKEIRTGVLEGQRHQVTQSCPTLCNLVDYTVHGILQSRILTWGAFPAPGHLPNPGIKLRSPALCVDSLPAEHKGSPIALGRGPQKYPQDHSLKLGLGHGEGFESLIPEGSGFIHSPFPVSTCQAFSRLMKPLTVWNLCCPFQRGLWLRGNFTRRAGQD